MKKFIGMFDEIETNSILKGFFILALFGLVFFSLISGVNAKIFNEGTSSNDIQNFINNEQDQEIIFNEGTYNNLLNLNITRSVNISSNGQVNLKGNGGTLFNISGNNVNISYLNISGYQTAIRSNSSKISIIGNNISTTGYSIYCTGSNSLDLRLENNNIISAHTSYGYGAFNIKVPLYSVNKVHMKGNNITANGNGTYSTGVWLNLGMQYYETGDIENTLIIENNHISGTGYAGLHVSAGYAKNNMTLINNFITNSGKNSLNYAVNIAASGSSNIVNIRNNTFIGPDAHGLYMYGDIGNNEITLINNTINGGGADGHGFYFLALKSNNTITLINNNITGNGTTRQGVDLDIDYSNNTIIFRENNIQAIGKGHFAVYIHGDGGNNTMTFTKNNFTGATRGISLVVDFAKNNIIFSENNLVGTNYAGMFLYITSSKNNNIQFIKNNFSSNLYAIGLWAFGDCGGLSFVNNTFTSNDTAIFTIVRDSDFKNVNFTGNTIIASKKGFDFEDHSNAKSFVGLKVNYNRIIAPIGLDFTLVQNQNSDFDKNWWGLNDIGKKILGFTTESNYILCIINLSSLEHVVIGEKVNFALLVLNTSLTNEGVENLPQFVINGTFNEIPFYSYWEDSYTYEFTILKEGIEIILDHLDEQDMDFSFLGLIPEITNPDNGNNTTDNETNNNTGNETNNNTDNGTNNNTNNGTDNNTNNNTDKNTNNGTEKNPDIVITNPPENGGDNSEEDKIYDEEDVAAGDDYPVNSEEDENINFDNDATIEDTESQKEKDVSNSYSGMKQTGVPLAIIVIIVFISILSNFRFRKNGK